MLRMSDDTKAIAVGLMLIGALVAASIGATLLMLPARG